MATYKAHYAFIFMDIFPQFTDLKKQRAYFNKNDFNEKQLSKLKEWKLRSRNGFYAIDIDFVSRFRLILEKLV